MAQNVNCIVIGIVFFFLRKVMREAKSYNHSIDVSKKKMKTIWNIMKNVTGSPYIKS